MQLESSCGVEMKEFNDLSGEILIRLLPNHEVGNAKYLKCKISSVARNSESSPSITT